MVLIGGGDWDAAAVDAAICEWRAGKWEGSVIIVVGIGLGLGLWWRDELGSLGVSSLWEEIVERERAGEVEPNACWKDLYIRG